MKFVVEVDPKRNPNAVGELLRGKFFAAKLGAYNWLDWASNAKKLDDEPVEGDYGEDYHRAEMEIDGNKIKCRWFADGDTTLQFVFSDGSVLENDDAKKVYCWRFYSKDEFKARYENLDVAEMLDDQIDESKLMEVVE